MNRKTVDTIWLCVSIISFLLMSLTFLLMPLDNMIMDGRFDGANLISGICFWAFLLVGIATQILLAKRRKDWYRIHRMKKSMGKQPRIGALSFFENVFAVVADSMVVISLAGLVISMILTHGTGYICYVFIALLVFSVCMHCIFNGKIYYHITNQERFLRVITKERENAEKMNGGAESHA